jgi:hypothetical protein
VIGAMQTNFKQNLIYKICSSREIERKEKDFDNNWKLSLLFSRVHDLVNKL